MPELRIAGARALMRVAAVLTGVSVAALGLGVPAARAETSPAVGQPLTVSADGLPTWQINGVVWSQAVVGNTVYVAGNFTRARPPGVAAGGPGEVDANNAFAYDITTGNRVASFSHQLNGQGRTSCGRPPMARRCTTAVTSRPSTVRPGAHLAAFDTTTNALSTTFKPVVGCAGGRDRDHRKHRLRGWLPPQRQRSGEELPRGVRRLQRQRAAVGAPQRTPP